MTAGIKADDSHFKLQTSFEEITTTAGEILTLSYIACTNGNKDGFNRTGSCSTSNWSYQWKRYELNLANVYAVLR